MPADFQYKLRFYTTPPNVHATMDGLTGFDTEEDLAGRFTEGVLCYSPKGWKHGQLPE